MRIHVLAIFITLALFGSVFSSEGLGDSSSGSLGHELGKPSFISTHSVTAINDDSLKYRESRLKQRWGVVSKSAGISAIATGSFFTLFCIAFEMPEYAMLSLIGTGTGVFLTAKGSKLIKEGNALRLETAYIPGSNGQIRFGIQYQTFLAAKFHTPYSYSEDLRNVPRRIACEIGILTDRNMFYGIYGQFLDFGAMAVVLYEWHPRPILSFSAGGKVGYLQDQWKETLHQQFGGPEIRVVLGKGVWRISAESQLWVDKVAQYSKVTDYYYSYNQTVPNDSIIKVKAELGDVGLSPSVSLKFQLAIPVKK